MSRESNFLIDYALNNKDEWRLINSIVLLQYEITSYKTLIAEQRIIGIENFAAYLKATGIVLSRIAHEQNIKELNNLLKIYEFRFC